MQPTLEDVYEEYTNKEEIFDHLKFTRYVQCNYRSKFKYLEISKFLKSHAAIIDEFNKSPQKSKLKSKSKSALNVGSQLLKEQDSGKKEKEKEKETPGADHEEEEDEDRDDDDGERQTPGNKSCSKSWSKSFSSTNENKNDYEKIVGEQDIELPKEFLDEETSNQSSENVTQGGTQGGTQGITRIKIGSIGDLAQRFESLSRARSSSSSSSVFGKSYKSGSKSHRYYIPQRQGGQSSAAIGKGVKRIGYGGPRSNSFDDSGDGAPGIDKSTLNINKDRNLNIDFKMENWHSWDEYTTRLFLKNCVVNSVGNKISYLSKIERNCNLVGSELSQLNSIALKIMGIEDNNDRANVLIYIRDAIFNQSKGSDDTIDNNDKSDINMDHGMCIICINKYQASKDKDEDNDNDNENEETEKNKINFGHLHLCQECYNECKP